MAASNCILGVVLLAALAPLALAMPPYSMLTSGICEDIGMATITDEGVCLEAGLAIFGVEKTFRTDQPTGGYRDVNHRPRGCTFVYGDDQLAGELLLFSLAPGFCGTHSADFTCMCGSRAEPSSAPAPPPAGASPVPLGLAGGFAILTKAGISTVPSSVITGDVGVSPIAATAMTGFSLKADKSKTFSKSAQVTGQLFGASYAAPTPADLTTAVLDMGTAYTDAAGRAISAPANLNIQSGLLISGTTFTPGVYKWVSDVTFASDIYIKGNRDSLFLFQLTGNVVAGSGAMVPTPYTLHPTLYPNPTPHTLHPTPYTLHSTLYTLHPTPHTLHSVL